MGGASCLNGGDMRQDQFRPEDISVLECLGLAMNPNVSHVGVHEKDTLGSLLAARMQRSINAFIYRHGLDTINHLVITEYGCQIRSLDRYYYPHLITLMRQQLPAFFCLLRRELQTLKMALMPSSREVR
jgi:hypothetical protein